MLSQLELLQRQRARKRGAEPSPGDTGAPWQLTCLCHPQPDGSPLPPYTNGQATRFSLLLVLYKQTAFIIWYIRVCYTFIKKN